MSREHLGEPCYTSKALGGTQLPFRLSLIQPETSSSQGPRYSQSHIYTMMRQFYNLIKSMLRHYYHGTQACI
ncbi:hypothetical protein EUGRSUZ_K03386 [Eucalyptus grandis]|uniref:Uncharacterized protein n=2 Tax=Eucalyptus grandis TaxID=71139 RepID=A0ACC3IZL1_EUCGR|nr:hypothetical protein EUGRSUZ_K03386 [Eucalyptus grandis]